MGYRRKILDARKIRERLKKDKNFDKYMTAKKQCFGKAAYPSEKTVLAKIADIALLGRRGLRYYQCTYCDLWHISSHKFEDQQFIS